MEQSTQAVILAGGRGKRLAPLTDALPKPMIQFHDKPFLEYLIEMLRDQGFKRILLLLGYLPEVIQNYFGDGQRWGVSIEYSISDIEDDTGRRIKRAQPLLDPVFLLMYCDNYWPMPFTHMWQKFVTSGVSAQITVYRNTDHYTRDNVLVDSEEYVLDYDKSRKKPGLHGVDIGFAILKHSTIDMLSDENVLFEKEVYPQLVSRRQLGAYLTDHRYYSVGSSDRLPLTDAFLARRPTVFLDRDGVLNKKMPRAEYVLAWNQWEWLPGALEALKIFTEAGYRVVIITNQPGVARGVMTQATLDEIHERMKAEVVKSGGRIHAVYCCPHDWDEGCECRKPKAGLLYQAQRDYHLALSRTYCIGADARDAQPAERAGCPWALVSDESSLLGTAGKLVNGVFEKGKVHRE
jgi:D-glycero-D-manno-heptose 1,7-bisphosphate phosphatase